jgi:hypothetical protein
MRPPVLPAVLAMMLLSHPLAQADDDRRRGPDRDRGRNHDRSLPHRDPPQASVAGWGKLRTRAQGMCLDAAGWAAKGNADALLWACNNDPDHVWLFAPTGEIKNAESGLCLTTADRPGKGGPRGDQRGDDVGVDRCDGSRSQLWTVVPRARGSFEVRNGRRGLCLDVDGRRGAQGDNVLLWSCDGGIDQTWGWDPVSAPPPRIAQRPGHEPPYGRRGPPQIRPMDPPAFQALLTAIRGGSFSSNQMAVIEEAAAYHHFLVAQLREIVKSLSFSANQVRAVELIAPRLVDPQNGFTLFDAFTFSRDQERVKRILERARQAQPQAPPGTR